MPRQWQTKEVSDHGGGITDDIKNAPPVFQAEANNIIYDFKTHNLSNRRGSKIIRDSNGDFEPGLVAALGGNEIDQIFQLEDDLVINSWNAESYTGPMNTYNEKTQVVKAVLTPNSRKGLDKYALDQEQASFFVEILDGDSKGLEGNLISSGLDSNNTNHIDHIIFDVRAINELESASVAATNYYRRFNVLYVEIAYTTLSGEFVTNVTYEEIRVVLNLVGSHVFTLKDGTSQTDFLTLTSDYQVSNFLTKAKFGDETQRRDAMSRRGHLQAPIYVGEAYVALEPYDKSFEVNPFDKDMKDPENFPPLTDRDSIKRISQFWDGTNPSPEIRDSQLPTTYLEPLGKEPIFTEETSLGATGNQTEITSAYKYVVMRLNFFEEPISDPDDPFSKIEIWMERLTGYIDGGLGNPPLQYEVVLEPVSIPVGEWALVDFDDVQSDRFGVFAQLNGVVNSGTLCFVKNIDDAAVQTGQQLLDGIQAAIDEYLMRDVSFKLYTDLRMTIRPFGVFDVSTQYQPTHIPYDVEYRSLLDPDLGVFLYNYAFYLKETYTKLDDGVPKLVENNGPASFLQVGTLSEIGPLTNTIGYWAGNNQSPSNPPDQTSVVSLSPTLIGSISKRFTRVDSDWFDFNDIVGVYARTLNTGTIYYDVFETNWFKPNELSLDPDATFDPAEWDGEDYGYFTEIEDSIFDRDLEGQELAYFNGGVASYTGIAQGAYYMDIINGTAYFGNIIDNEARVFQSAPGIPSSAPRLLFSDFEDPMTAVNSFLEKPIVFTENKTWRIEGIKDATGVGRVFLRVVSDEFGCISNQSVIKTNIGLFYWSKVGVIYTDGLRSVRVTEHLLARFQTWKGALMPDGLEIGPRGLRGAYDEVSKQIIYSSLKPETVAISRDIYVPPIVSENYVFPKGLLLPQVNLLTFAIPFGAGSVKVIIDGVEGNPVAWAASDDASMQAVADSIAIDFPGEATGIVLGGVGSLIVQVTGNNQTVPYSVSATWTEPQTIISSQVENPVWAIVQRDNPYNLYLEITVKDDSDLFFNEIHARLLGAFGEVIKLVDRDYNVWSFTTNYIVLSDPLDIVEKVASEGYYTVSVQLIDDIGAQELWQTEITLNGVLVQTRQDLLDNFGQYNAFEYSAWDANNNPGSFSTTDPESSTWYSFRLDTVLPGIKVSVQLPEPGINSFVFTGVDTPDFDNFFDELVAFFATEGDLLWITDKTNVRWKLTSLGTDISEVTRDSNTQISIVLTNNVTVTKDGALSSVNDLYIEFVDWLNTDETQWYQYQGMGFRKTEHLGAKHPLPQPYGVPEWILLDLYYGTSKSMPFYKASGPSLLQDSRRYKRDAFQSRVVWFSEDTLNVYRGQVGYDGYDEAKVLGSVVLTHEELLTNDEVYRTLDYPIYSPVNPFYKSVALSHGSKGSRKWTSKVMINFDDLNKTGVSIQPLGWNDLNPKPHLLSPCINYQHFKAIDFAPEVNPDFPPTIIQYFKNTDTSFYGEHLISYRRRFPRGRIRNVYKQFGFQQLVQEYLSISSALTEVSEVTVTKIDNQPFSPIKVRIDLASELKTYILCNGVSYVRFSWDVETPDGCQAPRIPDNSTWHKITEVTNDNINGGDPSYLEFIALTATSTLTTPVAPLIGETVIIGRSPLDQSLQLSDWTMTYTMLGDRTMGLPKSKELGGHN